MARMTPAAPSPEPLVEHRDASHDGYAKRASGCRRSSVGHRLGHEGISHEAGPASEPNALICRWSAGQTEGRPLRRVDTEPNLPLFRHTDYRPGGDTDACGDPCDGVRQLLTTGGLKNAGSGSQPLDGFDTREQAVEKWLTLSEAPDGRDWKNANYVISDNGQVAWVLRWNGTARARLNLVERDGYSVHGYDACAT